MSFKHVGFQGSGLLAKRGFLALSFLAIARTMGPAAFGDFTYVCTWLFIFGLVLGLGLAPVTTREIARDPQMAHTILRFGLLIRIVLSILGIVLLNILFDWTPIGRPGIRGYAFLASLCLPPLAFSDQISAYALGFDAHHRFAIVNVTLWGCYLGSTVLALVLGRSLIWVFASQLMAVWIAALICGFWFRRALSRTVSISEGWDTSVFLLREAIPLAITSVLGILSFRIGAFLLYRFAGPMETGLYTSALQVVEGLQLIAMAVTGAKFPALCRAANDRKRTNDVVEKLFLVLAFLGLYVAATVCVIGNRLMALVFGQSFSPAGHLLAILIWTSVPMFLHYGLTYVLIAANRQRVFVFETVVYLAVGATASVALIQRYGAVGAVYAAVLSESALLVMHLFFVVSRVKVGRILAWAVFPFLLAIVVLYFGTTWEHDINASLPSILVFCTASLGLFGAGYWLYWRLSTQIRPPIAIPAI
jgi:O-antigen/teichoic acid export membrane protein